MTDWLQIGKEYVKAAYCYPAYLTYADFSSAQFSCSVVFESLIPPWPAAHQTSLSITNSRNLLKLIFIELVTPSNHLILCHPLLLLPSVFSSIRMFSNELVFAEALQLQHYSFQLISFRTDLLDLLAVQGTLKRLLQHRSSKHQFFSGQLSL